MSDVLLWAVTTILLVFLTAWGAYVSSGRRWHKIVVIVAGSCAVFLTIWQATRTYQIQRQTQEEQRQLRSQRQEEQGRLQSQIQEGQKLLRSQIKELTRTSNETNKNVGQLTETLLWPKEKQKIVPIEKPKTPAGTEGFTVATSTSTSTSTSIPAGFGIVPTQPVAHVRFAERQVSSSTDAAPYGLQVIIQTDVPIQNAAFKIHCDGIIYNGRFFVAGQGAMMNVYQKIINGTTFTFRFGFPAFTPDSPIVVTLLAKSKIRVKQIEQW